MALRDDILAGKKKLNKDIFSLNPSAVISLFIIDFTEIAAQLHIPNLSALKFYFHNNLKLTTQEILFNITKQVDDLTGDDFLTSFVPAPIRTEGFEYSGRGTLPTPKISITVQEEYLELMTTLKEQIWAIGDLSGAKLTRIRTLAKYLHPSNFYSGETPENNSYDRHAEFQRDIYYIDRKSAENKSFIEYELASILDLQGIKIPGRLVSSTRCVWSYRGPGCMYEVEYRAVGQETIHGRNKSTVGVYELHNNHTLLPVEAPPVATINDEFIYEILGFRSQSSIATKTAVKFDSSKLLEYVKGDVVYLETNGIKYYYVCFPNEGNSTNPTTNPPNTSDWKADQCSKTIRGCKLRWGRKGTAVYSEEATKEYGYSTTYLPFGGFPATQRAS